MTDVGPLYALRLRTTRLELRLGSRDELLALGRLAEAGVHPPEEMPFSVAWTDGAGTPGFLADFVAHHEQALASWTPERWSLNLLVWADGELAGSQTLGAERFARDRGVATGSWLGQAYQRRGIGTEMRAAVLELAFHGLDAQTAASSWLEGNEASRCVSEKLGYRPVGLRIESPRGEPVTAHQVELRRPEWRPPVEVDIAGLDGCLPLFGVSRAL